MQDRKLQFAQLFGQHERYEHVTIRVMPIYDDAVATADFAGDFHLASYGFRSCRDCGDVGRLSPGEHAGLVGGSWQADLHAAGHATSQMTAFPEHP